MGKLVEHYENISNSSIKLQRGVASHQTQNITSISSLSQLRHLRTVAAENCTLSQKVEEISFE